MKLALVGNGKIVKVALEALKYVENIEVCAICVRKQSEQKGRELVDKYNIPALWTDYSQMLKSKSVDFVYIGIVNNKHYQYTKEALERNINVILEKPSCQKAVEIEELVQLAKQKHLYLFEAVTFLHTPFFKFIRENLTRLGNIKLLQCNFSKYSTRYDDYLQGKVHPVFDPKQDGGTLLDMNIYCLNFVVALMGEPKIVEYKANHGFNGVDTSGIALLIYSNSIASCAASKDSNSPSFMIIQGDKGWMKIEGAPDNLIAFHSCIDGIVQTTDIKAVPHRMIDEFEDFVRMYQEQKYEEMEQWMTNSVKVARTAERAFNSMKLSLASN